MALSREAQLERLRTERFDVLVIGGGATGAGVALDAATRGLRVALVERGDFSSGTSSRSTKLVHGGVRYLEHAVKRLDRSQFQLVRDALRERRTLLRIAPHLARPMSLLTPLYAWMAVPYFWTGLKLYDLLAGRANLAPSGFLPAKRAAERFPMLKKDGLRGGVLYVDGQFDDARMNLALVLTAIEQGAAAANHVEVEGLLKEHGRVRGAAVRDGVSGRRLDVAARIVVNATGPFADGVRRMDDPDAEPMLTASSGVHVILGARFSPPETGLLIPRTEDGRVLFLLPWQGRTLVGTTDAPATISRDPTASEEEIEYILRHVRSYFDLPVGREDVQAAWSGLRPLVTGPGTEDTASVSRDHVVQVSDAGLVTVTGGKWTTYRLMAADAVDQAVRVGELAPERPSATETLPLHGAAGFDPDAPFGPDGLDEDVAAHLRRAYGDRAPLVAELARDGYGARLAPTHPYLEAEVVYAARHELATTADDVLRHRTRLAFLDEAAAREARPRVEELLSRTEDTLAR